MKIKRLHIKNYKSIKELEIDDAQDALILVGRNNSGKSVILDAIRVALGDKTVNMPDFNGPEGNIIIGNVALYGATSGKVYINGVAGERFCVRNSGATAVVEGVGDHGCEYMTGGKVAVIGKVGKNFAAGMSGGIAYVLDLDSRLYQKVNKAMVNIERVTDKYDVQELKGMIQEHVAYTNSEVGKKILDNFKEYLPKFKKIIPEDYEKMMSTIIQMEEKGLSREKAKIEAFNLIKNGR